MWHEPVSHNQTRVSGCQLELGNLESHRARRSQSLIQLKHALQPAGSDICNIRCRFEAESHPAISEQHLGRDGYESKVVTPHFSEETRQARSLALGALRACRPGTRDQGRSRLIWPHELLSFEARASRHKYCARHDRESVDSFPSYISVPHMNNTGSYCTILYTSSLGDEAPVMASLAEVPTDCHAFLKEKLAAAGYAEVCNKEIKVIVAHFRMVGWTTKMSNMKQNVMLCSQVSAEHGVGLLPKEFTMQPGAYRVMVDTTAEHFECMRASTVVFFPGICEQ